ncbi:MAG: 3-deoxy-7-phosphoheptulonate synthase [Crocinitomicaceae bacterium]|nr:3-deoxy-7-phosphoheptulonate synthase [Crocinitomicaceae bacterium]|tara:strand:+ start:1838 stop:2836 length:999 start_codon:yes stop_codon:yes gene_type:complete
MILHLKENTTTERAREIADKINAFHVVSNNTNVLISGSGMKTVPTEIEPEVDESWVFDNDIQLASKNYQSEKREVTIGNVTIGGNQNSTLLIGGPCSVESEDQIRESAELLVEMGLTTLRGGCYKPRTSPYSFQGMGLDGLKLLAKMGEEFGLNVITEARDASHIHEVIEYSDVIQVGAKAMYDQGILRACAKTQKPVLIKRGFGSTLKEFVQAAEFVLSGGNENVILCERGLRTFETNTRFTLDLCGVAWLQEHTNLPIVLDPSHAMGYAYGVPVLAKACVAMGIDGLLIEAHRDPTVAKSDASQQLNHEEFKQLLNQLKPVAAAVGYKMI